MTDRTSRTTGRLAALACVLALLGAVPAHATWSLVWSDEFNGTSLDVANWTTDVGNGCPNLCGWGNNELEYYRSQNVSVTGGNLVITTKQENYGGSSFTSGKVHTRGKHAFLYGRMEMRAKLPVGGGMWPAFWMMPQSDVYGGWAASGEIDIMESSNAMTSVGGALHYGGTWPDNTSTSGSRSLGGTSYADDFHVYAVEWEPDAIRWYVDGVLFMTRTSAQWYSAGAPSNPRAPFDQEFYIILNAAVGGWYTGCTDVGCVTATFPQEYLIDYVRVYEDIANEAPTVAITSPTTADNPPAGDIVVTATAADSDGTIARVEFYNGATYLGEDATAPFSFTWTGVADGCYALTARAVDDLGGTAEDVVDLTVGAGCGQAAYPGTPFALPTRIQAEDYDVGGEGVAYHDLDAANSGGVYRPAEGVDIEACTDTDGGYNVGWTDPGEWLEYTVTAPSTGEYTIDVRASSQSGGGAFHLEWDGVAVTGSVAVPSTTGWQTWTTVPTTATLTAGTHVLRFAIDAAGFNLNWIDVQGGWVVDVPTPADAAYVLHPCYPNPFNPVTTIRYELGAPASVSLAVYDVAGHLVRQLVSGMEPAGSHAVVWDGHDETGAVAAAGLYFYRLDAGEYSQTRRMTLLK